MLLAHQIQLDRTIDPLSLLEIEDSGHGARFFWKSDATSICAIGIAREIHGSFHSRRAIAEQCATISSKVQWTSREAQLPWIGAFPFGTKIGGSRGATRSRDIWFVLPRILVTRTAEDITLTVVASATDCAGVRQTAETMRDLLTRFEGQPRSESRCHFVLEEDEMRMFPERFLDAHRSVTNNSLQKVVISAQQSFRLDSQPDLPAMIRAKRDGEPACYAYMLQRDPSESLVGASPELLVRKNGNAAETVAMAGTTSVGPDPEANLELQRCLLSDPKEREEHEFVRRDIMRRLRGRVVDYDSEPSVLRLRSLHHLVTRIRFESRAHRSALEEALLLHPTPAVCGSPRATASDTISRIEGRDRGYFTGAVGWITGNGDGEFSVVLRTVLVRKRRLIAAAGVGIVPASKLENEQVELGRKLQATLHGTGYTQPN